MNPNLSDVQSAPKKSHLYNIIRWGNSGTLASEYLNALSPVIRKKNEINVKTPPKVENNNKAIKKPFQELLIEVDLMNVLQKFPPAVDVLIYKRNVIEMPPLPAQHSWVLLKMTTNGNMNSIPFFIKGKQANIPTYLLINLMAKSHLERKEIVQTYKPHSGSSKFVTIFIYPKIKTHFFVGLEINI